MPKIISFAGINLSVEVDENVSLENVEDYCNDVLFRLNKILLETTFNKEGIVSLWVTSEEVPEEDVEIYDADTGVVLFSQVVGE